MRGVFDIGYEEFNRGIVCSLQNFQQLYRLDDDVHGLLVMIKDPYQADRVAAELDAALGKNYYVQTWTFKNSLMDAVKVEKNMMLFILFFIVIVAAFGITCTLVTFVVMKTRDIGVMKALGASNRQVMWIFLSQSMVVSLWGVGVGLSLGLAAVAYRNPLSAPDAAVDRHAAFPGGHLWLQRIARAHLADGHCDHLRRVVPDLHGGGGVPGLERQPPQTSGGPAP